MADDMLAHRVRRDPPKTQREACALAARMSIAAFGPVPASGVKATAAGIAMGLFGPAFDAAGEAQKAAWLRMCEDEYRRAAGIEVMEVDGADRT